MRLVFAPPRPLCIVIELSNDEMPEQFNINVIDTFEVVLIEPLR